MWKLFGTNFYIFLPIKYLGLEGENAVPTMLVGGFNLSEDNWDKLKEYQPKHFYLGFKKYLAEQITLSGRCINLTFSGYIHLIRKHYVYLSHPCIQ